MNLNLNASRVLTVVEWTPARNIQNWNHKFDNDCVRCSDNAATYVETEFATKKNVENNWKYYSLFYSFELIDYTDLHVLTYAC